MQNNTINVSPIEKIVSILSYLTMGIVGLIWLVIGYITNKKLRYFLMYNITQSMLISIICAAFFFGLWILSLIPFLEFLSAILNLILTVKIVNIFLLSFSIFQLIITILITYIIIGILFERIFYVPFLSNIMNKVMKSYK